MFIFIGIVSLSWQLLADADSRPNTFSFMKGHNIECDVI